MSEFAELVAPDHWRAVDFISDLHLQPSEPETLKAWLGYLQTSPADAIFMLGDVFEVWVGDDAAAMPGFEADCVAALERAAQRRPIYFMHGNRDFLVGADFAARCGITLLEDPTVLVLHGERRLLSHGDWLCVEDTEYQRFRKQVRNPAWQQAFLARPLAARRAVARDMRAASIEHQRGPGVVLAEVDAAAARRWLRDADAPTLIHGHTHRPAEHDLGDGLKRVVLSDWDAEARPPRAQVLCLSSAGERRVDLR